MAPNIKKSVHSSDFKPYLLIGIIYRLVREEEREREEEVGRNKWGREGIGRDREKRK
jgi:hypothetical protein